MDSEDSPEGDYSSRRNGEGSSGAGGGSLQVGLEVEPPLGAVSSTSSSSPTRPLFTWPTATTGTMLVNSSSDLAPSTSSSSTHGAPVRRDPFDDDGVNSFADDPFAHDGSDPDDPASAEGLRRRPESGGDDTGDDEGGGDRFRDRSTEEGGSIFIDEGEGDTPRPYDPYGRPSSSAVHHPSSGLLSSSPPPFLRAFSAPVATSRLGNLVHPGRRPSQSNTNSRPSHLTPSISINSSDYPTRPSYLSQQSGADSVSSNLCNSTANDHLASDSVSSSSRLDPSSSPPTPPPTGLYTLSLELADSVQAAIQTLLQLTPPHLFDTAKEQFSACTVQMPATSLTSLLTAMKNLNYLSEHIAPLCADESLLHSPSLSSASTPSPLPTFSEDGSSSDPSISTSRPFPSPFGTSRASFGAESMASLQTIASEPSSMLQDFDIGEMVQSVGDLLGGLTAQAGRRGDRHAL
ncbi:hypothetical protein BDY24DRAFT_405431 [Mrakia frigida]|uniref:uncharacterized protein n=1 Tax=Mrakia frigida TaxID=29902 RepID=UPI003FCC21C2